MTDPTIIGCLITPRPPKRRGVVLLPTPLKIGPRQGEFGKSWTRRIGRNLYWFEIRRSPAGRRLQVMRVSPDPGHPRAITHWLYDCEPAAYEAYTTGGYR